MPRVTARVTGIVFLAVTALGFVGAVLIPSPESSSDPGPSGYPLFVLTLMALCALGLLISPGTTAGTDEETERDWKQVAFVLVCLALYAAVVSFAGFIVSTALFTAALLFFADKRKPLVLIAYPIVLSVALYYIFNIYLSVALPSGPLERLIS